MFIHMLNNFEINEETLALDSIAQIGIGGHHFGTPHTQSRYETAFYAPLVTDRQAFEPWEAGGSKDTLQRANRLYKRLLQSYEKPAIDPAIEEALSDFVERRSQELENVDLYN